MLYALSFLFCSRSRLTGLFLGALARHPPPRHYFVVAHFTTYVRRHVIAFLGGSILVAKMFGRMYSERWGASARC